MTKVWADNTDYVQRRRCRWSRSTRPMPARRLKRPRPQLAASVRQTRQQMINSKQLQANIDVQKNRPRPGAELTCNRRVPLGNAANLIGREELQHARDASRQRTGRNSTSQSSSTTPTRRSMLGTRLEQQPAVHQAATEVRNAWLALQRTPYRQPDELATFPVAAVAAWRADRHHHAADGGGPGDQPVDRC